jgi:transposase-like protein
VPVDTEVPQIKQRKRWGRPPNIPKPKQDALFASLKDGHYIETACRLHGVEITTLYEWLKRAQDPLAHNHRRYAVFREALLAAIADGEEATLKRVRESESLDWRAAAWRLERRFPRKWGRVPVDEVVVPPTPQPGDPGAPPTETQNVTRMLSALSPEAILDLAGKLFARPGMVEVPDEGVAQDVQAANAVPTLEEKARMA